MSRCRWVTNIVAVAVTLSLIVPRLAAACLPLQAGGSAPDVWLQLLEHCAGVSSCQPAVVRGLGMQLVEQQQLVNSLQQQVDTLQQQCTEQQQQIGQQAAEAVELQGRMAVLADQVAQLMQAMQHKG